MKDADEINTISKLIAVYGYLSLLVQLQKQKKKNVKVSTLLDAGFDMHYIKQAVQYLLNKKLLTRTQDTLALTTKGKQIASQVA